MNRVEDWPERLLALIDERRTATFKWGAQDCCAFPADAVLAMTGVDPMAALRGRYNSARSAAVLMEKVGGIAAFLDALLPQVPPLLARRGDVVMFDADDGPVLGIACGVTAAAAGPNGVTWIPLAQWRLAWRVGGIV